MKRLLSVIFSLSLLTGFVYAKPAMPVYAIKETPKVVYWSKGKQPLKDYKLILDDLANQLKDNGTLSLQIRGYADPSTEKKKAQKLSLERAQWAKDYIVSKGISESRIGITALGDEQPVYSGKSKKEQAKNRRVEVSLSHGDVQ